jgi:hypothetical protein
MTTRKVKRVRWRDSRLMIHQEPPDADFSVCIIDSVGFVLHEDKDRIVLAGDLVEDDVRRVISIPRENVISGRAGR